EVALRAGEEPMVPHLGRAVGLQPPSSDRRPKDSSCAQPRAPKPELAQPPRHRVPLSADRKVPVRSGATNPRYLRTRRSALRDRAHGEETFRGPCLKKSCQLIAATRSSSAASCRLGFAPLLHVRGGTVRRDDPASTLSPGVGCSTAWLRMDSRFDSKDLLSINGLT